MKKFLKLLLVLVMIMGAVFLLGPRESIDETITFDPGSLGDDLDDYLKRGEQDIANLRDGAQKQIVWNDAAIRNKTLWSVVYVHGFSATLEEVRPLPDIVAKELGANLFYTRLAGHGRDGSAMAEPSLNDWYNDVAETLAIGRALGEQVVVISTSTGGTIATWAASKPKLMKNVAGMIMISPNYAVKAAGSSALSMPWARQILPLIFGKDRSFEPRSKDQEKWWTTKYPNVALLPMQASLENAATIEFEEIEVPALFVFHPDDRVVDHSVSRQIANRWGNNNKAKATIVEDTNSTDAFRHVIAGRILSPENTEPLAQKAIEWVRGL